VGYGGVRVNFVSYRKIANKIPTLSSVYENTVTVVGVEFATLKVYG
jgi:hypothetical protein